MSELIYYSYCFSIWISFCNVSLIIDPGIDPLGNMLFGNWIILYSLSTNVTPYPVIFPTLNVYCKIYYSVKEELEFINLVFVFLN